MSNIRFNSKRIPGSVVVFKDNWAVAAIFVNKDRDSVTSKFNDRVVIPLARLEPHTHDLLTSIKPGTYQEVKAAVIEAFKEIP